jgi:hypothetical protein
LSVKDVSFFERIQSGQAMIKKTECATRCATCGGAGARRYEYRRFGAAGEDAAIEEHLLCPRCARRHRQQMGEQAAGPDPGVTRAELMSELEQFFSSSGALEICSRCHEQGTGCCPAPCRSLTPTGCRGKTLWCSAFICSALLNAISECDPGVGRHLKWLKREVGPTEFHLFEIVSRAPAVLREDIRPLALPHRYPRLPEIGHGEALRGPLLELADEILEVRRNWRRIEEAEQAQMDARPAKGRC